jgi:phosphoglycolate phosphatase-like HAD superfamily hydrolase
MQYFIFDLDHTIIDSSHRQSNLADGSLDLAHWRENSTPEKVAQDTLLPLASQWLSLVDNLNVRIIVCTARVMASADYYFLQEHGLFADYILSRREGDTSGDAQLKIRLLNDFVESQGISWRRFIQGAVMFDDNKNVIKALKSIGLNVVDAVQTNNNLKAA